MILEPAVKERGSVKRAVGEFEGFDGDFDGVLDGHVTSVTATPTMAPLRRPGDGTGDDSIAWFG